jgi:ankyrin repeat protein
MKIDTNTLLNHDQTQINTVFINACDKGDLELVKFVLHDSRLKFKAEPVNTYVSSEPVSGFYLACKSGYLDIVQYLLNSKEIEIHPDINGDNGQALKNACSEGHFEIVKYLLCGKELKTKAKFFPSALIAASNKGHLDIVKYLLTDPKVNKDVNVSFYNNEAFLNACSGNHVDIAKYLLTSHEFKNNVNIKDYINSAIFHCCIDGAVNTLDYILHLPEAQEHLNIHFNDDAPFICAIEERHMHVVNYLIFEYNIVPTDNIKRYLKDYNFTEIEKWFEVKELSNVLNNPNDVKHKKLKL